MKKYIAIIAVVLAAASCSLNEEFTSYTKQEDFYNNKVQIQSGINACYNMIRSMFGGSSFWMTTECTTDLMYLNDPNAYNAILNISPAQPAFAATIWRYCYGGIMRSNAMIVAIDKAYENGAITDEDVLELKGETVVLRAFFYYLLTSAFGDVPFYTETVTEDNREQIASLPRMSADATRDYLIDELSEYVEYLPQKRSYDAPFQNRANAALGLMLAGKFCLWNHRWDDAIDILGRLEDIYGHYDATPEQFGQDYLLTDVPFSHKYIPESIFEMENQYEEYGVQQTATIAIYTTPTKSNKTVEVGGEDEESETEEYIISDNYNGICIPELGTSARISISARPTTYYFQTVLSYYSNDLRSGEYSNGATEPRGGSGNLAWRWSGYDPEDVVRDPDERSVRWFSTLGSGNASAKAIRRPWLGNKFWCPGMYYTLDSNNYRLFRYADAILMLAEAHLMAGHPDKAADYLNITRVRAGLEKLTGASTGGSADALMEEIRVERARELFGEFQRKFDLVRWGIWYERTIQYNEGKYLNDFIKPCHRYLPIPQDQVTYSHGALDNKEYQGN